MSKAQALLEYLGSIGHELYQLPVTKRGSVVQAIAVESFEGDKAGRSFVVTANFDWRKAGGVAGY